MRWTGLGTIVLAAIALLPMTATAAHAAEHKWCAVYGGRDMEATNCGFDTFEQCLATVSGVGGFCDLNLFYTGPEERSRRHQRRHRVYRHDY